MIASVLITSTENFAFIAFLVFKLFSRKNFVYKQKRQKNCLEVGYFLLANFCKYFECEILRIYFKYLSDHLAVVFQFTRMHLLNIHINPQQDGLQIYLK